MPPTSITFSYDNVLQEYSSPQNGKLHTRYSVEFYHIIVYFVPHESSTHIPSDFTIPNCSSCTGGLTAVSFTQGTRGSVQYRSQSYSQKHSCFFSHRGWRIVAEAFVLPWLIRTSDCLISCSGWGRASSSGSLHRGGSPEVSGRRVCLLVSVDP